MSGGTGPAAGPVIREAIILAGGLGTRLRSAVPDLPKCMAPVGGRPFIAYITDFYRHAGIERFIFALGYKSAAFDAFFEREFPDGTYAVSLEDSPLGTGGAIVYLSDPQSEYQEILLKARAPREAVTRYIEQRGTTAKSVAAAVAASKAEEPAVNCPPGLDCPPASCVLDDMSMNGQVD